MARKKKEEQQSPTKRPEGYQILIGYIKDFTFDFEDEDMLGHPKVGKCYRLIKDKYGYRLHIGKENNNHGLDGIMLDKIPLRNGVLKGRRTSFSFEIILVTPKNYLDLGIDEEDTKQVAEWLSTDNEDMWKNLKVEGAAIAALKDLTNILETKEVVRREDEDDPGTITFEPVRDADGRVNPKDLRASKVLASSLTVLSVKEPEALNTLVGLVEYLASTYQDKYEHTDFPNVSKQLITQGSIGGNINMWQVMKYAQRYMTTGYEKSYNIKDLYKIIHYALFELQRRKHQDERHG